MNLFDRIGLGLRAWFDAWFIEGAAESIAPAVRSRSALPAPEQTPPPAETPPPAKAKPSRDAAPSRSEAIILLEVLQREARLVDFLKEDLTDYDDAQIGAAVRDIHRDSAGVLERIFALRPIKSEEEGASVEVQNDSSGQTRLVGNVREGAMRGTLVHAGWRATRAELPRWSGPKEAEMIVAPAEIEL